ncbi:hypothetical protein D3C85_551710 [compost metagenome]
MDRRELIKNIVFLTGATFLGADLFLVGCKSDKNSNFKGEDIIFLDEIAETIIPKTNTPGAKDAETGKFIARYATDCYTDSDQKILQEGLIELDESATKKYGYSFIKITNTQKKELLTIIDREAKEYQQHKEEKAPTHYFTMIKQLTLFGFFTSEAGATQVLRYNPVPGKYEGCIPYIKGEKSWS